MFRYLIFLLFCSICFLGCKHIDVGSKNNKQANHYFPESSFEDVSYCLFTVDNKDYAVSFGYYGNERKRFIVKEGDIVGKEKMVITEIDYNENLVEGKNSDGYGFSYVGLPCYDN